MRLSLIPSIGVVCAALASAAAATEVDLPARAYAILREHCYACHGVDYLVDGLDVLNRANLVSDPGLGKTPYLTPGEPEKSRLWQQIEDGRMPKTDVKLTAEQVEVIRQWIASGAAFPSQAGPHKFISEAQMLRSIRDHVKGLPAADRPFQRYLSLTHLWNNPAVTERDLRLYRAALAKLINSLSQEADLISLTPVDPEQTVFCLDLRKIGWSSTDRWLTAISKYPYGLKPDSLPAGDLAEEILQALGRGAFSLPYVRGDWFAAATSQAPRYNTLVRLPKTRQELEKSLHVDWDQNFSENRLRRAAFTESGVSSQARVVERHLPAEGASDSMYWLSYDFFPGGERSNPMRFPLGPETQNNAFSAHAFRHGGGEIIFRLPNGLHGYMLVDKDGLRIDKAPTEVVWNRGTPATGSPTIVNGLSCMECHRTGMREFTDVVRDGVRLLDLDAQRKLSQLFPPKPEMDQLLAADEQAYLDTLEKVIGPWLRHAEDTSRNLRDFPEPISVLVRRYQQDVSVDDLAAEVWYAAPQDLATVIRGNSDLQLLGLGPLASPAQGRPARIKRAVLESLESAESTYQTACRALGGWHPIILP